MKPFTKGLLLGVFVTVSCVGFMANKNKPEIGRFLPMGGTSLAIVDTVTGDIILTMSKESSYNDLDHWIRHKLSIDKALQ